MKNILLLITLFVSVQSFGQSKPDFKVGDSIQILKGGLPNGDFKFITEKSFGSAITNSTPWVSGAKKKNATKNAMSRFHSNKVATIIDIKGENIFIKVNGSRFMIYTDLALDEKEIKKL